MPHPISIPTKAAISLLDDTTISDITPVLCPENSSFYYLDKTSVETVDSDITLSTNSGTGRWIKAGGSAVPYVFQSGPPTNQEYPEGTQIIDTLNQQMYFYIGWDGTLSSWFIVNGSNFTYS